ncbi:unnamed protein product [Euphydryas editha]|uniref:PiggyBac transposable element-derived protein domain-containing protein n=1 Tax=Euphydryas editha TaxID=104508 RepID=A0AAU9TL84_EUPED|nr:unnamed protein product [Euphydryas editha]
MSSRRSHLHDDEIVNFLAAGEDSEDGMDCDDDDVIDPDFEPLMEENSMSDDDVNTAGIDLDSIINEFEDTETILQPTVPDQQATTSGSNSRKKQSKRELQWKLKNLILNDQQVKFSGNSTLPSDLLELDTPIQFFLHLFPKEIMHFIAEQTNLYIIQKNPNQTFSVTESDIQKFIGIVFRMSLIKLPRVSSHWNTNIRTPTIYETIPNYKFEKIRQHLHFNENSSMPQRNAPGADKLFKIRPIVAKLNENFSKIIKEEYLCVDEQICSTKARNIMKRYNPKKPHKWGYKIYVLCGVTGFAYKFEIETGAENIVLPGEPDLGASSNVVVRMARDMPKYQNYKLYFDNYFTSLPLLEHLAKEGILSLGTVRRNRIPNCKLPADKELSKKERGYSMEFVADVGGIDISNVIWKDNKVVTMVSTFVGEMPKSQVRRYDKNNKRYINIDRPNIVAEYHRYMGGVDLVGSIMGYYKILIRSKRWQVRIFYHLLDLTMVNAWLLYRRVKFSSQNLEKHMSSAYFRLEIAETLCKLGNKTAIKNRKSTEIDIQAKKHKGPAQHIPPIAVRQDQVGHWPVWSENRIRCKFPKCTGVSQTICEKCCVALCYNKKNNCFKEFHTT